MDKIIKMFGSYSVMTALLRARHTAITNITNVLLYIIKFFIEEKAFYFLKNIDIY